ncbi:MAG: Uma2 family endonuclease [Planctomycetota bacterium]
MSVAAPLPPSANAPATPKSSSRDRLRNGMRMERREFHRRYELQPQGFRAELIKGVVYITDPMSKNRPHGRWTYLIQQWLGMYERRTPTVIGRADTTTALGEFSEPEPDAQLRHRSEDEADEADVVTGPPGLVVEVADSTRRLDLGVKRHDYETEGVPEYLVVDLQRRQVRWFIRDDDQLFVDLAPDADGLYKSRVFPGLWLNAAALFAEDLTALEAAVEVGVAERDAA